jgi:type II secretory pathway pseudopilin PulG
VALRTAARRAFSLVEVVIAIGVFAAAIVAIIGLLGPTLRTTREVLDSTVAARLAEGVEGELKRVGFTNVSSAVSAGVLVVYARSDGSRLVTHEDRKDSVLGIPANERYYVLFVDLLAAPSVSSAALPLEIRVEWPYQTLTADPDDLPLSNAQRSSFSFNTALLR